MSKMLDFSTKTGRRAASALLALPIVLLGPGHAAKAQSTTPGLGCVAALEATMADWRSAGFAEPGKPGQMIVYGRPGYHTTGGNVRYMGQEIRLGARECEAGNDAAALAHLNAVREALTHTHTM